MARAFRTILLALTTVLTLVVVVAILGASFMYVRRSANERSVHDYKITADGIERALLGLYLKAQGDVAAEPVDPSDDEQLLFVIEPGESLTSVSLKLEEMNLIADAEVFRRMVQYHGADSDIQVGTYMLARSMTMEQIMEKLQRGLLPSETVSILEGWRMEQVAKALEAGGITDAASFLAMATSSDAYVYWPFLEARPENAPVGLEGFLFPDTYQFVANTSAEDVVQIMLRNFDWRFSEDLRLKAEQAGMSVYQVVVLASIVEREAMIPEERPVIASVFLNRLAIDMPLQADPTVQYAIGCNQETGDCWPQLLRDDLNSVVSPYNTYLNPGLPPGPICNPGLASIEAVLSPADTRYLYFLAKPDGSHVFAETYEEHLENDARYGQP
ncbi:MAG: endolytic transglycosylase MltG [Anaerolineae bacterium]|jgi:UPF0755 protein|nr:endolytic transglycosylase MltG [Chloroflexota bacterium]